MNTTPKFDKETYLRKGGLFCPYCGSQHIEAGDIDGGAGEIFQTVVCLTCDRDWTDFYKLVSVEPGEA